MVFGKNMGKTRLPVVILLLLIALYWRHHGELNPEETDLDWTVTEERPQRHC